MSEERLQATFTARETFFRTLGTMGTDVWSPLINPTFMGGPSWPALRQGWRDTHRGRNTLIVSDGLSDPFDDQQEPNIGFGVEILAESPDELGDDIRASWLFHLVYQVSQNAANYGGFREVVEQYNVFTMEIDSEGLIPNHENAEGRVGLLLGFGAPDLSIETPLPGGTLRLIPVKLLTLPELEYVAEKKQQGREHLCSCFATDRSYHLSSLNRKSAV